ncbi:hypothetical protein DERF_000203 [Dermatophagoides farinae]|uniref:Uncharacterized protein n=1 Tax=Dermatophagoides farinae TaxID=6954 RepID=A0A922I9H4_DERFA|nr:hypothetical protein DERF_000203 [Dermatophagoides farinae]
MCRHSNDIKIERSNTVLANVLLLDVNRIAKTSNDTKLSLAQISVEFVFDDNNQWIDKHQVVYEKIPKHNIQSYHNFKIIYTWPFESDLIGQISKIYFKIDGQSQQHS